MSKTASGLSLRQLKASAVPVPDGKPETAWEERGRRIWVTVNRSAWELGDWWNDGEPYGDRVDAARRIGGEDWPKTCRDAGWVAANVSVRNDTLSWSHHRMVAALPAIDQRKWLAAAEKNGWGANELRVQIQALPGHRKPPPALPQGTFDVLLADPPWRYDDATPNRRVENHYPTMEVDEIAELEVPAAPNAVLYLWATAPKLREALIVLNAWEFDYKTNLVWVKPQIGMGYWARGRHELLLIATRGEPGTPAEADRPESVIEAPRMKHSEKPEKVYGLIERALPGRAYLELFARSGRPGWTSWGNEL